MEGCKQRITFLQECGGGQGEERIYRGKGKSKKPKLGYNYNNWQLENGQ